MKINKLYQFLNSNRQYNHSVQSGFYNECITPYKSPADKAKSLLFQILNTQSQPKIDKVAEFWQEILSDKKKLSSFKSFSIAIGGDQSNGTPFYNLFKALKAKPGWGGKTAALFVKAVYHVHNGKYKKYAFWKDVPKFKNDDKLLLPVDTVITYIFKRLSSEKIKSFSAINNELKECGYAGAKMELWDDLWFWGFITQKGPGNKRELGFNKPKYWALLHTDKTPAMIRRIKSNANKFIKLIE